MMKFTTSVAAVAAFALVDGVDALYRSKYAQQRVAETKAKLERNYGKGLVGLYGADGKFDIEKMHLVPRNYNAGAASVQINSLVIDATSRSAYWLGFVQGMQYAGLNRASDVLPGDSVELSNCFAVTYALLEDFKTQAYNINTFASTAGTIKLFDTLVYDPSIIFMDMTVEWEMCNGSAIFGQFKSMAGGDWASVSDNATRELMVIAFESPEAFQTINDIRKAAQCSVSAYQDINDEDEEIDQSEEQNQDRGEDSTWQFQSDTDTAKATGAAAQECFEDVDKYEIGKISGRLFSSFFNNDQQAV